MTRNNANFISFGPTFWQTEMRTACFSISFQSWMLKRMCGKKRLSLQSGSWIFLIVCS